MHKEFRVRVSIVIVILCCSAAVARSQDINEASAGTRSLGPLPFQLILPREHLLGDWYGTRTWLEDRGIVPTLTFVTDSLGNPSGGKEQGFTTANNVGLDLNFDLEKLCGSRGRLVFALNVISFRRQLVGELHSQCFYGSASLWRRNISSDQPGLPAETI